MEITCSVPGCENRYYEGSPVHFFRFPLEDSVMLAAWRYVINRKDWSPDNESRVCSMHFTRSDFTVCPETFVIKLKDNVIPTVYNTDPKQYQENTSMGASTSDGNSEVKSTRIKATVQEGEDRETITAAEKRMKRRIKILEERCKLREKKIKTLQELILVLKRKNSIDSIRSGKQVSECTEKIKGVIERMERLQ